MDFYKKYGSSESRREELIRNVSGKPNEQNDACINSAMARKGRMKYKIEVAVNNLTLEELEALHYDMMTKNYIND